MKGGLAVGVGEDRVKKSNGKKGGTTVTRQ